MSRMNGIGTAAKRAGLKTAYGFIYKLRIEKALAYRYDVFSGIIMQCIVMFANAFFWRAIYSGYETVRGAAVSDMLTYTIISSVMAVFLATGVEQRVMKSVEQGTVATDLLKPIPLFAIYFFEELGTITASALLCGLPILVVGSIFIVVPLPADAMHALLFACSFLLSFLINWLFAALFSLLAFVTINMSPLLQIKKHVLRLLSGGIIPIWFFPQWAQNLLRALPFVYIYQLPLELYIGRLSVPDALRQMGLQLFWVLILLIVFFYVQKRTMEKILVQGG